MKSHPHGVIPVLINDVVFGLHGFIASIITIFQCLFFEVGFIDSIPERSSIFSLAF
jgi:hypothetical protein